jgi:hypothetical protein
MEVTRHIVLDRMFILKFCYRGYLGSHNKPSFKATSYLFQSVGGIVHFHICLN